MKKSMFFCTKNPKIIVLALALSLSLFTLSPALSWTGFDHENNTTIEIGPGNLVRENLTITIYDWSTDSYHDVDIIEMKSSFNGVRIEVLDLETQKKRVFEMEY